MRALRRALKMEYATIPKGRGFVYAHANQMYERVHTTDIVKYRTVPEVQCDKSARMVAGQLFFLWVIHYSAYAVNRF